MRGGGGEDLKERKVTSSNVKSKERELIKDKKNKTKKNKKPWFGDLEATCTYDSNFS